MLQPELRDKSSSSSIVCNEVCILTQHTVNWILRILTMDSGGKVSESDQNKTKQLLTQCVQNVLSDRLGPDEDLGGFREFSRPP